MIWLHLCSLMCALSVNHLQNFPLPSALLWNCAMENTNLPCLVNLALKQKYSFWYCTFKTSIYSNYKIMFYNRNSILEYELRCRDNCVTYQTKHILEDWECRLFIEYTYWLVVFFIDYRMNHHPVKMTVEVLIRILWAISLKFSTALEATAIGRHFVCPQNS